MKLADKYTAFEDTNGIADVLALVTDIENLRQQADLDPLKSTHIISPGYTHMANLTEEISEKPKLRGRCLGMMPKQWADYIATAVNAVPVLIDKIRAARREALFYQFRLAERMATMVRLRVAIQIISKFVLNDYDSLVVMKIEEWIDRGVDTPIPWPATPFFEDWARAKGLSNFDGYVGFKLEQYWADKQDNQEPRVVFTKVDNFAEATPFADDPRRAYGLLDGQFGVWCDNGDPVVWLRIAEVVEP